MVSFPTLSLLPTSRYQQREEEEKHAENAQQPNGTDSQPDTGAEEKAFLGLRLRAGRARTSTALQPAGPPARAAAPSVRRSTVVPSGGAGARGGGGRCAGQRHYDGDAGADECRVGRGGAVCCRTVSAGAAASAGVVGRASVEACRA